MPADRSGAAALGQALQRREWAHRAAAEWRDSAQRSLGSKLLSAPQNTGFSLQLYFHTW